MLQENPLGVFFEFLVLSVNLNNFEEARILVNNFMSACSNLKCNVSFTSFHDVQKYKRN